MVILVCKLPIYAVFIDELTNYTSVHLLSSKRALPLDYITKIDRALARLGRRQISVTYNVLSKDKIIVPIVRAGRQITFYYYAHIVGCEKTCTTVVLLARLHQISLKKIINDISGNTVAELVLLLTPYISHIPRRWAGSRC